MKRFARKIRRSAPLTRQVAKAIARTIARRATDGPKLPSWSFRYEALIELLRIQFGDEMPDDINVVRRAFDAMGRQEDARNRSRTTWVKLAGLDAAWVEPLHANTSGIVLYLHGGGYVVGSPSSHRGLMASIATHARVRVVGIDYRLAPEHPCPAGIADATAAYCALLEEHAPEQIVVAGDSAGGGLTAATLCAIREAGLPRPAAGVMLSPWVDLRRESNQWSNVEYDYIVRELSDWEQSYARDLGREDPQVSPMLADLSALPPLLVIAGGVEALVHQAREFASRAQAAEVDCTLHVEPEEVHVYPAFFDLSPRAQSGLGRIGGFIRHVLDAPTPTVRFPS